MTVWGRPGSSVVGGVATCTKVPVRPAKRSGFATPPITARMPPPRRQSPPGRPATRRPPRRIVPGTCLDRFEEFPGFAVFITGCPIGPGRRSRCPRGPGHRRWNSVVARGAISTGFARRVGRSKGSSLPMPPPPVAEAGGWRFERGVSRRRCLTPSPSISLWLGWSSSIYTTRQRRCDRSVPGFVPAGL